MRPHSSPYIKKEFSNTIALCSFFALLSIIGFYLSLWQYQRGQEKLQLIEARGAPIAFKRDFDQFLLIVEQGNRQNLVYYLGSANGNNIALSEELINSEVSQGYWHPIEKNVFQSEEIIEHNDTLCAAYSLWACNKCLNNQIFGVLKSQPWRPSMTPERHNAYAMQWAALGAVAFFMAVINLRPLIPRFTHVFFNTSSAA